MTVKKALAVSALTTAALTTTLFTGSAAQADPTPGVVHAINVCQSATIYTGWNPAFNGIAGNSHYTIYWGNKIGKQTQAPVYNGWATVFDYGPQRWGWMRDECIGGYGSW